MPDKPKKDFDTEKHELEEIKDHIKDGGDAFGRMTKELKRALVRVRSIQPRSRETNRELFKLENKIKKQPPEQRQNALKQLEHFLKKIAIWDNSLTKTTKEIDEIKRKGKELNTEQKSRQKKLEKKQMMTVGLISTLQLKLGQTGLKPERRKELKQALLQHEYVDQKTLFLLKMNGKLQGTWTGLENSTLKLIRRHILREKMRIKDMRQRIHFQKQQQLREEKSLSQEKQKERKMKKHLKLHAQQRLARQKLAARRKLLEEKRAISPFKKRPSFG